LNTDKLQFVGKVIKGCGKFSELIVPGKADLPVKIRDWPDKIEPGTLNVHIKDSDFPQKYIDEFHSTGTACLDTRRFQPEAELPFDAIGPGWNGTSFFNSAIVRV